MRAHRPPTLRRIRAQGATKLIGCIELHGNYDTKRDLKLRTGKLPQG
jgi:hypothetical protein